MTLTSPGDTVLRISPWPALAEAAEQFAVLASEPDSDDEAIREALLDRLTRTVLQGDEPEVLCALTDGARQLAAAARALELAAAELARERGATVRRLAQATGMTERRATERYRRTPPTSTTEI